MKRSIAWLTALLQMAILLTVVACATPWLDAEESSLPTPRRTGDVTLRGYQARPIFNGSVVAGGAYSTAELRAAIGRDPVVARHYDAANVDEMQAVTLTAGRAAYVSYRRGDRVYWTRQRVWLAAGETVLTDGVTVIRARCGNCVSDAKQADVAEVDPAHGELDDFVVPPTPDSGVDPLAADAEAGLGDLLQVPFAPASFALLAPGGALLIPDLLGDSVGGTGMPVFGVPPILLPGGGEPLDDPSGVPPSLPPPGFVPPEGGTGSPGTTSGTPGGGTGVPGGITTDTGLPTTGVLTDGTVFPTTVGASTSSSGVTEAPEPGSLWLVTAGLIGYASRRLRRR